MSAPIPPKTQHQKSAAPKPRISKTRELQKVFRHGKAVHATSLVIKFVRIPGLKTSRMAFVVSRKVSKRAVLRNRIRRVIREELRTKLLPKMPIADYVIIVKPVAATYENADLRKEVSIAAGKIRPY
jgi:ribonuclease P protein component